MQMEKTLQVLRPYYPVLMFLISTVGVIICAFSSVGTTDLLAPGTCEKVPSVTISTSDDPHTLLAELIKLATDIVQISCTEVNDTLFEGTYLPALIQAKANGARIELFISVKNAELLAKLKEQEFTMIDILGSEVLLCTQSMVIDKTAVIIRSLADSGEVDGPRKLTSIIIFNECQVAVDDILGFTRFFMQKDTNSLPGVIPGDLAAKTSAVLPAKAGNSQFYLFHNPPSYNQPLRTDTATIISNMINSNRPEIKVYSVVPPIMSTTSGPGSGNYQFYVEFKKALLMNQTKIKYLVSEQIKKTENKVWCNALAAFSNVELRTYPQRLEGIDFILCDKQSYVFTHPLRSFEMSNWLSLHYATNDTETYETLNNLYDLVWELSTPYVPVWNA